jgi:type 1 glutamine amidotransferase
MNFLLHSSFSLFGLVLLLGCATGKEPITKADQTRILVFYKTAGFYHTSIPVGVAALQKLGAEHNFLVDTTKVATNFNTANLAKYQAVVFLNTTGDVLNDTQQQAFEGYIRAGNGFVGIHAATDTEYGWPWYNGLVGAYFSSHPAIQLATIRVINKNHAATAALPDTWPRTDEWYNFKDISPTIQVLATLDEQSYTGGSNGSSHPFIWYHAYQGGRAFYTAGGHTNESYQEPLFLQHLLGGIRYATGKAK